MTVPATTSQVRTLGIVSTVGDAALAFYRGQRASALFLLGMAALSTKLTGVGLAGSLAVRLARRLR